jgi:hypothetical protein
MFLSGMKATHKKAKSKKIPVIRSTYPKEKAFAMKMLKEEGFAKGFEHMAVNPVTGQKEKVSFKKRIRETKQQAKEAFIAAARAQNEAEMVARMKEYHAHLKMIHKLKYYKEKSERQAIRSLYENPEEARSELKRHRLDRSRWEEKAQVDIPLNTPPVPHPPRLPSPAEAAAAASARQQ